MVKAIFGIGLARHLPWLALLLLVSACHEAEVPGRSLVSTQTVELLEVGQAISLELPAPDRPLLVEIRGEDSNFRSAVTETDGSVLSEVELAYLRSAPVFHLVDPSPGTRRSLRIVPVQTTRLSRLTVYLYELDGGTEPGSPADAWRKLTRGIEYVGSEKEADWQDNLRALEQARSAFKRLGQFEWALWADYYRAYFEYYPLYRYSESLEVAMMLISESEKQQLADLGMLAHQLAGQILIEREASNDEEQARRDYESAQQHFRRALASARSQDNGFEQVWSINNMGITSKYQGHSNRAIEHYREALDQAIGLEDSFLVNLIGMNMAVAQETLGEIREAINTLHRIEKEMLLEGDPIELDHLWALLGLYYLSLHEFPEALANTHKSLEIADRIERAESQGRDHLQLAQTYHQMGQAEKSLSHVDLAVPYLEASRNGRGLRRAHGLTADLQRAAGRFDAMREARAAQEQYLATDADRAEWYLGQGRDAEAEGHWQLAAQKYLEASQRFGETPFVFNGQIALLHACQLMPEGGSELCSLADLETKTREVRQHQASNLMLEARFLWARILAANGQLTEARAEMDGLVDDIAYYRDRLPGVLGSWYWDARSELFEFYLDLALRSPDSGDDNARRSFLALMRLRQASSPVVGSTSLPADRLRELIANRDRARSHKERVLAQGQIDLYLLDIRGEASGRDSPDRTSDFLQQLETLPATWSLLTYHLGGREALAWTAGRDGLRLHRLGDAAALREQLSATRANLRVVNHASLREELAMLGQAMLSPLLGELEENVLFLGAGELSVFPLDALVVDERFLLQQRHVFNLASSLDTLQPAEDSQSPFIPAQVFLAGNPGMEPGSRPELQGSARELDQVEEQFAAARIIRHEGASLTREAFDGTFATSDLVHIASHASIDVMYPELSRIELSGDYLVPADVAGRSFENQLIVLSACSTAGVGRFEFDSNLGFVSELLQAGSASVMASLWPVSDRASVQFFERFYGYLGSGEPVAAALRRAKRELIDAGSVGIDQWAAYQLYFN